jgi:hypothetical protein
MGGGAEDPGEVGAAERLDDRGVRIRRLRGTCWCNCAEHWGGWEAWWRRRRRGGGGGGAVEEAEARSRPTGRRHPWA